MEEGLLLRTFHAGLGEQAGSQHGVKGGRHGHHGQILGADAAMLAGHVRVQ